MEKKKKKKKKNIVLSMILNSSISSDIVTDRSDLTVKIIILCRLFKLK